MESISKELDRLFDRLITTGIDILPNLALAVLVISIGLILANVVRRLVKRAIQYLHDKVNSDLTGRSLKIDVQGYAVFISKMIFWIIIAITVIITTRTLGFTVLTSLMDKVILFLPKIFASVTIVLLGIFTGKITNGLIVSAMAGAKGAPTGKSLGRLMKYTILVISIIIATEQVGIDILFLVHTFDILLGAILFGASLAFGLGARTSVSNILGVFYLQKNYSEGDTIRISDVQGVIIKITDTAVFLETDVGQVCIPAKEFNEQKTILIKKD